MSFLALGRMPLTLENRRRFLSGTGLALSGTAVALLAGREALAAAADWPPANDVAILNSEPVPAAFVS
jgi:hypothetical protein